VKGGTWSAWYIGSIPWRAIDAWGFRHGFSVEGVDLLAEVIRRLDGDRAEQQAAEFQAATQGG
jgi:hypothetical protein